MNFRIITLSFFLLFTYGCGVKSKPIKPPDKVIGSYINSYLDVESNKKTLDTTKTIKNK